MLNILRKKNLLSTKSNFKCVQKVIYQVDIINVEYYTFL